MKPDPRKIRQPFPGAPRYDALWDLGMECARRRYLAEWDVACAALAHPPEYVPVLKRAGVKPEHFGHDDLRIIWNVVAGATSDPYPPLVAALAAAGLWQRGVTHRSWADDRSAYWGMMKLAAAATRRADLTYRVDDFAICEVRRIGMELVELSRRTSRAMELYRRAVAEVTFPEGPIVPPSLDRLGSEDRKGRTMRSVVSWLRTRRKARVA